MKTNDKTRPLGLLTRPNEEYGNVRVYTDTMYFLNELVDECVDVLLTIQILLEVYNATENEIKSLMDFKLNRLRDFLPRK